MKTHRKMYNARYGGFLEAYFRNNLREYTICSIIFLIGILLGIVFFNNLSSSQNLEISTYISNSISNIKSINNFSSFELLREGIKNNIITTFSLWILGSTVIGMLLVYLILGFKGFCFGYSISAIIYTLGTGKGTLFALSTIFLKNIIAIPCIIALAVSGMKLYKSIMQDKRKENIKLEVVRHTLFSLFVLILLITSSIIEVYSSQTFLKIFIKYI